jgi:hypothetical protein
MSGSIFGGETDDVATSVLLFYTSSNGKANIMVQNHLGLCPTP